MRSPTHPANTKFGSYVATRRHELKLSQGKLAALLGVNRTYVSRIETGDRRVPQSATLIRLAVALDVPLSTLMVRGGIVEKCRHPEYLDSAIEALEGWRSTLRITESVRVLDELATILADNGDKVTKDYRHLLNPLKTHANTLKRELRVSISPNPKGNNGAA